MKLTKKHLEILLSKIPFLKYPKIKLEQYPISAALAARMLWIAHITYDDIRNKIVLDLGVGSGRLAIGASLLDAEYVIGIDIDFDILKLFKDCVDKFELSNIDIVCSDVGFISFRKKADTILQNPPFGVYKPGFDIYFLENAIRLGKTVYSIHKLETREYVIDFLKNLNLDTKLLFYDIIEIPPIYPKHREKWHPVRVFVVRVST